MYTCPVQVCKELDQSAVQVSDMQLGHALRTAITSSCAKYDDEDVIERLKARKDRSAAGERVCVGAT